MAQSRAWRIVTAFSLIAVLGLFGSTAQVRSAPTLAQAAAGPDWPHTNAGLKPDENARYGRLANGMRYVIYRNRAKARGAAMRFEIAAGSLQERDDQMGLAHFVEHMAFRGSKNQSDGDLAKTLKREGFAFGSDVNAFTDYETTKFVLDLPSNGDESITSALFILREIAGNLTFDADAIEHERGVILGEERMRASTSSRSQQAIIAAAYRDRLYARRDPIGTLDTIRTAPRKAIIDYYQEWYRPELGLLIVVGDFDVDAMERRIRTTFGDWAPARPGPIRQIDYGTSTVTAPQTLVYTEKNLYEGLGATWYRPYLDNPDSDATRTRGYLKNIAVTVLNDQLRRAAETPEAAFLSASIGYDNQRLSGNTTSLWVVPKPGRQREAFVQALRLFNRYKAKGVSAEDVADYIAASDAQLENMVRTSKTRFSDDIAEEILQSFNDENVFESAEQFRTDWARIKPAVTPSAVAEQMKTIFAGNGPLLIRQGEDPAAFDAKALMAAYTEAQSEGTDALPDIGAAVTWPYTDFGPATKPVAEERDEGLKYTHYVFANGVTANVRPNVLVKNQIIVQVRFTGGYRLFSPAENISLQALKIYDLNDGGLGKLTASQIARSLQARSVSMDYNLSEDAAALVGYTTRDSFAAQMQLLMAFATDPGYRPESFDAMKSSLDYIYQQLRSTPDYALGFGLGDFMAGHDPRYVFPPRAVLEAANPTDFFATYRRTMSQVPVEITITGDIREEAALAQLEKTFANLPKVPARFTPAPGSNRIVMPTDRTEQVYYHEGRPDQAKSSVIFPATDALGDIADTRGLMLLSEVFNARLDDELRTRLGLAYDGNVSLTASEVMTGFGYIEATGTVPPDKDQVFYDTVLNIAAELADKGVDQDELDRARNPLVQYMNDDNKNNEDWQSTLAGLYGDERRRSYRVKQYPAFMAVTTDDLKRLAQRYLKPDKVLRAKAIPVGTP